MKQIKLLLAVLFISNSLNAQNYVVDTTFQVDYPFYAWCHSRIGDLEFYDNENIVIAGNFDNYPLMTLVYILKTDHNGTIDVNFLPSQGVSEPLRVRVSGDYLYYFTSLRNIGRWNLDGTIDTSSWKANLTQHDVCIYSDFEILEDSTMIISGDFCNPFGDSINYNGTFLLKVLHDGSLDTTFRHYPDSMVWTIKKYDENRLLLWGKFESYDTIPRNVLCRVFNDGTLDTTFNTTIRWGAAKPKVILPDGKIIVAGAFIYGNNFDTTGIARLNVDGSFDTTFNYLNNVHYKKNGKTNEIMDICLTHNNKLLVGGMIYEYQGIERRNIVLTDYDGFLDTTTFKNGGIDFDTLGDGCYDHWEISVIGIKRTFDNKYYVYGGFNSFEGQQVNPIFRIMEGTNEIDESSFINEIEIYPNPADKKVFLNLKQSFNKESNIQIYDISGRLKYQQSLKPGIEMMEINTTELPPGIYLLRLEIKDGKSIIEKISVVH